MELHRRLAESAKSFYCVCFSIRAGSTLLAEDLTHWCAGAPSEAFQSPSYPGPADHSTGAYVLRLAREAPCGVFGFKATWGQVRTLLRRLGEEHPGGELDDLSAVFPGIRYIHLVRRDKVAQAVSAWRAISSGTWHWPVGSAADLGSPTYDFLAIRTQLLQILAEEWLWRCHFERRGLAHLEVCYEDYLADRAATLQAISDWLGCGRPARPVETLRVMRDQWSNEMVTRVWHDLAHASDVEEPQRIDTVTIGSSA